MNTFPLPSCPSGEIVLVQGNNLGEFPVTASAQHLVSYEEGSYPNWTIQSTGATVEHGGVSPGLKASKELIIQLPPISVWHYTITALLTVDISVTVDDIKAVPYTVDNQLFVVFCYAKKTTNEETHKLFVQTSFELSGSLLETTSDFSEVQAYLFREDPKTSRGTVTTVQTSRGPHIEPIEEHDVSSN